MQDQDNGQSEAPQPYLDADFAKELNYQLWVTKGARFHASQRLAAKQKWSSYAIAALAFYAIVANLLPIAIDGLDFILTGFVSSTLSIFILVISLLEGSRRYDLRSSRHHDCALEIGELYRKLRKLRTGPVANEVNRESAIDAIMNKYQNVLKRFENHEQVDYLLLQAKKSDYFQKGPIRRGWVQVRWYLEVYLPYHVAIFGPLVMVLLAWKMRLF